jgi:hypothetical protein
MVIRCHRVIVVGERKSIWNGTILAVGIFTVSLGVRSVTFMKRLGSAVTG